MKIYVNEIKEITRNPCIDLAIDTIKKKKQLIIFVNNKRSAEKLAEEIAKHIKLNNIILNELAYRILNVLEKPTEQCNRLSKCIKNGVAFHHSGLLNEQREIIEENFRKGIIKVIVSTPTLAAGVDLPAYRVIIRDVKRFGNNFYDYIPVLEYLQQAGRAGRPKYDKKGEAILISSNEFEKEKLFDKYILGEPEEIYSKLGAEPLLRTFVLSLIASEYVNKKENLLKFLSKTFWAFQFGNLDRLYENVERIIIELKQWNFIENEIINAYQINNEILKATPLGKRVSELYIDPLTAHTFCEGIKRLKKVSEFSVINLISQSIELKPYPSVKRKEYEKLEDEVLRNEKEFLINIPNEFDYEYETFIRTLKLTLIFLDWINEMDEEIIMEKYGIRPGELRNKVIIAEWLLYSLSEICRIVGKKDLINGIKKLQIRMKYGCKEELLKLIKLKGIGRIKARKLFNAGFKTIAKIKEAIKETNINKLISVIGEKTTNKILLQLGINKEILDEKENIQTQLSNY